MKSSSKGGSNRKTNVRHFVKTDFSYSKTKKDTRLIILKALYKTVCTYVYDWRTPFFSLLEFVFVQIIVAILVSQVF